MEQEFKSRRGEQYMTSKDQKISVPAKYRTGKSSRERMEQLRGMAAYHPQVDFDPDVISWVTPNVAVTDWEGGVHATEEGHFVICVADELDELGHVCIPIDPVDGRKRTVKTLERIANLIHWMVSETKKSVVVHCAMGMERSVIAVAWYLHKYQEMTLDEAYDAIGWVRPIAADRKHWVKST